MGIVALAILISIDTTRALVADGRGLGFDGVRYVAGSPALAIVGATNATPIVITTAQPHLVSSLPSFGCLGGLSCIVSGVGGNDAANNISTDPNDRTVGLSQGVLAVPLSDTTLALYRQSITDPTGIEPIPGSGAYTGGGTITPALVPGGICLGREYVTDNIAPPRIVMIPVSSSFAARSSSIPNGARTGDIAAQKSKRAVRTERITFEVRCGGQAATPNTAQDFDAARELAHWFIDSTHLLTAGSYEVTGGTWADQTPGATQRMKAGHEFVFGLTVNVPITDAPLPFATGVTVDATGKMQLDGGTPEIACQGTMS